MGGSLGFGSIEPDLGHTRNGDVAIAYQHVGPTDRVVD
jgi:hypothetical protein